MTQPNDESIWDFDSAIEFLRTFKIDKYNPLYELPQTDATDSEEYLSDSYYGLGDFTSVWNYLGLPKAAETTKKEDVVAYKINDVAVAELDSSQLSKAVRWRDELDGADLEDNVKSVKVTSANFRTQKRAATRARARDRAEKVVSSTEPFPDSATDVESAAEELETLRRSPDRRAVIADILGRPRPLNRDASSPPTSPSPPKVEARSTRKKEWPISQPFLYSTKLTDSRSRRPVIGNKDGLTPLQRKRALIQSLIAQHPNEKKYLLNSGLLEPAFTPLNVSNIGIHVFIDISNISIGFHDCLKLARGMQRETYVRRIPLSFHNFSLVLERGRPAAKRVLVGSDKSPAIQQAKELGYETNILERVHKAKDPTPRQKKHRSGGGNVSSGFETSGSDTNGYGLGFRAPQEKWVEQAVDEILHLKILESLIDADKPGTIVLATGDAAEAEYSGGFMRMVERALEKGWMVELMSFRLNTSSLYRRKEFRNRWGSMFEWIVLDDYIESLIEEEE